MDYNFTRVTDDYIFHNGDIVKVSVAYNWIPLFNPTNGQLQGAFDSNVGVASVSSVSIFTDENGADIILKVKDTIKNCAATLIRDEVMNMLQNFSDTVLKLYNLDVTDIYVADSVNRSILDKVVRTIEGKDTSPAPINTPAGVAAAKNAPPPDKPPLFSTSTLVGMFIIAIILAVFVVGVHEVKTI